MEWGLVGGLPTVGTYVLWVSVGTEATVEPYVRAFLRGKISIFTFYCVYRRNKPGGGHASLSAVSLSRAGQTRQASNWEGRQLTPLCIQKPRLLNARNFQPSS